MAYKRYQPGELRTPFLFFTGKGGVGKTSIASATAIQLAKAGKRVLIVSTDPASNLDDVFQLPLRDEPTAVKGISGLFASNLDPEEAARMYREKVVGPYRGILPDAAIVQIEEQLSGACTVEIAAFDEFSKLLASKEIQGEYDHIVLDTAPTGHTLRLLQLPMAWTGFLKESQHGSSCLGPLSGLGDKRELYADTVAALADPSRTTLILVARPDRASLAEAARASRELQELGLENQRFVLNGMLIDPEHDPVALRLVNRQTESLTHMPHNLTELPTSVVPLHAGSLTGTSALETLLDPQESAMPLDGGSDQVAEAKYLSPILEHLSGKSRGLILTMGKGGVGKTTVASALAVGLADRGKKVHLTTTDPAAHLDLTLGDFHHHPLLTVGRIDPKSVTEQYRKDVLAQNAFRLDQEGMALLEEDLASPCTEEIAVFRAFTEAVEQASSGFVVLDTAPTGHTLLLLDAAEAYHREVQRSTGDNPDPIQNLLPRLRNPDETDVILITLPEATPVLEAERLQDDLKRARIHPSWWVINQSWQSVPLTHSVLVHRSMAEAPWISRVAHTAERFTVLPWQPDEPVGVDSLRCLLSGPESSFTR